MRPIHLIAGTGIVAAVIVLFAGTGSPKLVGSGAAGAAVRQQAGANQLLSGDAQCVPSIVGEDQFEGNRQRNNLNRRYLFPRLYKQKTGVENDCN